MKQFIRVDDDYYSTDGILLIRCEKDDPKDILPSMVQNAIQCMEELENEHGTQIGSLTLDNLQQYCLVVTHMGEEFDISYPLDEHVVNNDVDADALLQHVVMSVATSDEPVLDLEDIVSHFANRSVANLIPEKQ